MKNEASSRECVDATHSFFHSQPNKYTWVASHPVPLRTWLCWDFMPLSGIFFKNSCYLSEEEVSSHGYSICNLDHLSA